MHLKDLIGVPEHIAFKQINRYVDNHVRNNNFSLVDSDLAQLKPDGLSVMLNICLIRALNKFKARLTNWNRYYIALRKHLTEQGYDAPFLLRGL